MRIIPRLKWLVLPLTLQLTACSNLLFYPAEQWVRTPEQLGLPYRDMNITSTDGTQLSAWWLTTEEEVKGNVLFLHGNAENISTHIASVYWLPEQGYQVLLLDYRGYGRSLGSPSVPGVIMDIEATLRWMTSQPEVQGKPLILLGQSLGAALGGYVVGQNSTAPQPAWRQQLDVVILDAGFSSYRRLAREKAAASWLTWPLQYPVAWTMPEEYDLVHVIDKISPTPLLLIHGTRDQIIPFQHAQSLFAAAHSPKSLLSYDGPHIATFNSEDNRHQVLMFIERALAGEPAFPQ